MFGKHFASMYERSMVGSGALVFAVWGYVIATARPDADVNIGAQVTINPDLLGTILGEEPSDVERAIIFLCSPDPKSTTKEEDGKRLVRLSQFDYRVVNYKKYRDIKDEANRREQNRMAQERFRNKRVRLQKGKPLSGEAQYERLMDDGETEAAQQLLDSQPGLPSHLVTDPTP